MLPCFVLLSPPSIRSAPTLAIGVNDNVRTNHAKPYRPLVVALLYDGLCTFEFGIVAKIFGLLRPEMGPEWYRSASCAVDKGPMRAHSGFVIKADSSPELLQQADVVVAPGWKGLTCLFPIGFAGNSAPRTKGARGLYPSAPALLCWQRPGCFPTEPRRHTGCWPRSEEKPRGAVA